MLRRLLDRLRDSTTTLGGRGERIAARWLKRRGYRIVERNYTVGHDEADLIAIDPDERFLVIVEVKTRQDNNVGPEEHVNLTKQRHLARLASRLLQEQRFKGSMIRFDVIAIVLSPGAEPTIRHFPSAFDSPF